MDPITLIALITTGIPFLTALAKKALHTDKWTSTKKSGVNALLPILLGIVSSGLAAHGQGMDWPTSVAIGLGSGGVAASARDIDKNLIGIANFVMTLFKKKT